MIAKNTHQVYSYSNDSPDINFRHNFTATRFMMTWKKFAKAIKTKIFLFIRGWDYPSLRWKTFNLKNHFRAP